MKKDFLLLAVITLFYMTAQYCARGYMAIGAEILFVPLGILLIVAKWREKDDNARN